MAKELPAITILHALTHLVHSARCHPIAVAPWHVANALGAIHLALQVPKVCHQVIPELTTQTGTANANSLRELRPQVLTTTTSSPTMCVCVTLPLQPGRYLHTSCAAPTRAAGTLRSMRGQQGGHHSGKMAPHPAGCRRNPVSITISCANVWW